MSVLTKIPIDVHVRDWIRQLEADRKIHPGGGESDTRDGSSAETAVRGSRQGSAGASQQVADRS